MFDDFSGQWWEFWIDHWNRPSLKMQIPHQKGCYAYASCKFAVQQTAIVRSYDLFGLFPRDRCGAVLTRIYTYLDEGSPVERFLRNPMAVLLTIRADFPCFALKSAQHSPKLPPEKQKTIWLLQRKELCQRVPVVHLK